MTIGEKIALRRKALGLTQTELAEKLGTTKQTIGKYEKGIVTNIPLSRVAELADALECTPEYLTGWEERREREQDAGEAHEVRMIARAGKRMSPEKRQEMLRVLRAIFPEEFQDDGT